MPMYDYLIVGAGLFGSVFAHEMTKAGYRCLVIEKRRHIGGNCYTEKIADIDCHKYGPHVFHTEKKEIWDYVNQFAEFNSCQNQTKSISRGKVYSFPINLSTLYQVWGIKTPAEAKEKLSSVRIPINDPQNLEEWALSQVGQELYELLFKGYIKKKWLSDPKDLPISIIKRLPLTFNFYECYYENYPFQGIPKEGYTKLFERLLNKIEILRNTDYLRNTVLHSMAEKILFTGKIDEFFDYKLGHLDYIGLTFTTETLPIDNYQGIAIMNFADESVPYTRIIEHKHFTFGSQTHTVVTFEYTQPYSPNDIPYYPINDIKNSRLHSEYMQLRPANVLFGGRIAEYKYYDMNHTIENALALAKKEQCSLERT